MIKWIVLISGCVAIVAEHIQTDLFKVTAGRMAKEMRYDLFHCYFKKCAKLDTKIDKD